MGHRWKRPERALQEPTAVTGTVNQLRRVCTAASGAASPMVVTVAVGVGPGWRRRATVKRKVITGSLGRRIVNCCTSVLVKLQPERVSNKRTRPGCERTAEAQAPRGYPAELREDLLGVG